MPTHRIHRRVSRLILGKAYPKVDRIIDAPSMVMSKGHRRYFHSPVEAAAISLLVCGDPLPGLLHVATDYMWPTFRVRKKPSISWRGNKVL